MFDPTSTPDELLQPIANVLEAALPRAPGLRPDDVMVVGAACRDVLHHALGHRFATSATHDLDLALALSSWGAYRSLATTFPKVGNTGIRFNIAETIVDLLPFGDIEEPEGEAQPPTRSEPFSVWAFEEIFAAAQPLALPTGAAVKIPTVAGYAAMKLGAWLDRSEWLEVKDARDLALAAYWYEHSTEVRDRLYDTDAGNTALLAEEADVPRAAAYLLGIDIATTIGERRLAELITRWPGNLELLVGEFAVPGKAAAGETRRRDIIDALTSGITGRRGR
jgi:predicted nucleotidyltransferase